MAEFFDFKLANQELDNNYVFKFHNDLMFSDEITVESVNIFIKLFAKELQNLEQYIYTFRELNTPYFELPFTIYINSEGGDVIAGFSLYDYLNSVKQSYGIPIRITTKAVGLTASMAALIYLLGDFRIIGKNSQVMLHTITGGTYGKYHDAKSQMKQLDILNNQIKEIIKERTGLPEEMVENLMSKDTFLDSNECVKLGIAHTIE